MMIREIIRIVINLSTLFLNETNDAISTAITANIDDRETNLRHQKTSNHTTKLISPKEGETDIMQAKEVATPLPPRNLRKTG
jgi:hypothetical protein